MRNIFFSLVVLFSTTAAMAQVDNDLAEEKRLSREYLEKMAQEPGAQVLENGVVIRPLFINPNGQLPTVNDSVIVSYFLTDRLGALIEESFRADEAMNFPLGQLISCWKIAFPHIATGSFYKISCPSDTAYGDRGSLPEIKPGAALTFRVNLYDIP